MFTRNRERLLEGDIAQAFFDAALAEARNKDLLSDERFTVDGTLLEAWASKKSFQRKDSDLNGDKNRDGGPETPTATGDSDGR